MSAIKECIGVYVPEKAFWCLMPLISREIASVSRRSRAMPAEDHSEYLAQLQQCLGAVATASRHFLASGGMVPVSDALRCDDEAAP